MSLAQHQGLSVFSDAPGTFKDASLINARKGQAKTRGTKKEQFAATGIKTRPCPATGEPEYTRNQQEYLMAVDTFKRRFHKPFLSVTDYLDIAESLGWQRPTGTAPASWVGEAEAAERFAA